MSSKLKGSYSKELEDLEKSIKELPSDGSKDAIKEVLKDRYSGILKAYPGLVKEGVLLSKRKRIEKVLGKPDTILKPKSPKPKSPDLRYFEFRKETTRTQCRRRRKLYKQASSFRACLL